MNQTERFDVKLSNLDISEEDPVGGSGHEFEVRGNSAAT
jgi:hypothetical protein